MFSISQIRAQARQTISSTPCIFLLPIIPVAMTFIRTVFQYIRNDKLKELLHDQNPLSNKDYLKILASYMNCENPQTCDEFNKERLINQHKKGIIYLYNNPNNNILNYKRLNENVWT